VHFGGQFEHETRSLKSVPRVLSDYQKPLPVSVCKELKQPARDDSSFISDITTGDETWVYGYDPETKQQSSQWKSLNSPLSKKACQGGSIVKAVLILFFFLKSKELSKRISYPPVSLSMTFLTMRF
jgi:hypothetical protein